MQVQHCSISNQTKGVRDCDDTWRSWKSKLSAPCQKLADYIREQFQKKPYRERPFQGVKLVNVYTVVRGSFGTLCIRVPAYANLLPSF